MEFRGVAERLFETLCRYNQNVARLSQYDPGFREEIIGKLENDIRAIVYAIPSDALDAIIEKIEDALGLGTAGVSAPAVEAIGFVLERLVLLPVEKKYYEAVKKAHPGAPLILQAYQIATEIPVLDSILSLIPEKTLYAVSAFIYDVVSIIRRARRYGRDYVEEMYGKRGVVGGEGYPHPLRPALQAYA